MGDLRGAQPKKKRIRLSREKMRKLHEKCWERDEGICQECGCWVEKGVPCHHVIPRGQGGDDVLDNLKLLCLACHYRVHHGGKK